DLDPARPRPALVVTGAWMTIKEQMPARYAREMADRGFAALTFDFRGWGESGGARRQYEDPSAKIADIEAAVAYLANRPETDKDRIGGLGICASSGYMVTAAAKDAAIKSVALVAPWLHDAEVVE
ncbi:MAG: alpha/beta hydrolase, partial [Mesorhizobium sp.]